MTDFEIVFFFPTIISKVGKFKMILFNSAYGQRPTPSLMSTLKLYDIFLNEFPLYIGKCHKSSSDISQNMLEIHSKI